MKYTKLFNEHQQYVAYTASTSFVRPNMSYCILENECHLVSSGSCQEGHTYGLITDSVSYPQIVPASATSFNLYFRYTDTYTPITCQQKIMTNSDIVPIAIEENPSTSARTISGTYYFNGIPIEYSLTQEGTGEIPYNQQYLTFEVLTSGTIMWVANNNETKTISYSINNGEWTQITSSAEGTPINVSVGDKVRFKGNNGSYASAKDTVSMFSGGTATYDAYGNAMSLIGGDNFSGLTSFNNQEWAFHDLFNTSNVVSAKNLILPVTTLTSCCYRAMFAHAKKLTEAPELPATTLASSGYCYMFQECTSLTTAPDLLAENIVNSCYTGMFNSASTLNYIKCTATSGIATGNTKDWTKGVASSGTFIKASNASSWTTGVNGIPTNWIVYNDTNVEVPVISFDGFDTITITCETEGADIFYKLNNVGEYSAYTTAITITADTFIESYATYSGETSRSISQTCQYVSDVPIEYSNRDLKKWTYANQEITTPYSINAIDGHSANYAKGAFTFETSFALKEAEPTYLWFQHADHKADIYVDNILVDTHWGGYVSFFSDISNYVHKGTNNIKVVLKNNNGNYLAPASGDFNFNATFGKVKLFTSPYMPAMNYGYDGFHITSTVSTGTATINVATSIPTGATVVCTISGVNCNYTVTSASTGEEMIFTTTINNPRLWNGKIDPYLYNVKLEIYHDNELYHRYERPYGLRFYEYVINDIVKYGTAQNPYTGFLLNGQPYLLRGCCMHDDIADKANALNDTDYSNTFATIQELGLNFLRLAHYPHPRETYDWCDRLGIVVQTEGPCVNKLQSTMPTEYYERLNGQYTDMVNQHYNHPCIFFWGLSNETTTDDKAFGKTKIEGYTSLIKNLDSERMVGYVLAQSPGTSPSAYYNDPSNVDWFGCNIYVGWYDSPNSNNPTSQINTRLNNTIGRVGKPMAYTEYGCGGTQACHSDDFMTTTTRGNNPRHDIEYMMWLHEGHIAAIKNFPQLMFTSQWQLFDIAVSSRNEGYTVCLDGVNTSTDDSLRYLNNKGLVERDHVTKKDTFYLYKAWWNTTDKFVHICGKDYEKVSQRTIKCYTNDGNSLTMYINGTSAETVTVTNNIATFAARNFTSGDTVMVSGSTTNDSFIISGVTAPFITAKYNVTSTSNSTKIGYNQYTSGFSEIEIDGVVQTAVTSAYTFTTTGEHTVKYTLTDPTSIGNLVFYQCSNITSIDIPNSVTSIGMYAFTDCTSLTSIDIPSGVTSIGSSAFSGCTSLTSIDIPSGVTTIGNSAFNGCSSLTSIDIPSGLTSISGYAFSGCTSLTSIDIPDSVTSIGNYAFQGCTGLTSCTIGSGVTSINESAFANCSNLKSVIMEAITPPILGNSVFYNSKKIIVYVPTCSSVSAYKAANTWSDYRNVIISLDCPTLEATFNVTDTTNSTRITYDTNIFALIEIDGIKMTTRSGYTFSTTGDHTVKYYLNGTSINGNAFTFCWNLTSINIPDSVTSIGGNAFSQCSGLTRINSDVDGVFNIPDSVTSIGGFDGCKGLTSINIPDSVTNIGVGAFSGCSNLTSIDIPSGVTSIGSNTFRGCRSLTSIEIPSGVTSIGYDAFYGCSSLTSITIKATTPPTLGTSTFDYTNDCPIYVPNGSLNTYQSAWSDYASRIQAIP